MKITYNGKVFCVDSKLFAQNSSVFNENVDLASLGSVSLNIEGKYKMSSFEKFLLAVQGKETNMSFDDLDEVRSLAEEWGAKNVLEQIDNFLNSSASKPDKILMSVLHKVKAKKEVDDDDIDYLAENIDAILEIEAFSLLPGKIIESIFKNRKCNISDKHKMFDFIYNYNQKNGKWSSYLFNLLDVNDLSDDEIKKLTDDNDKIDSKKCVNLMKVIAFKCFKKYIHEKENGKRIKKKHNKLIRNKNLEIIQLKNSVNKISKNQPKQQNNNLNYRGIKDKNKNNNIIIKNESKPVQKNQLVITNSRTSIDSKNKEQSKQQQYEIEKRSSSKKLHITIDKPKPICIEKPKTHINPYVTSGKSNIQVEKRQKSEAFQIKKMVIPEKNNEPQQIPKEKIEVKPNISRSVDLQPKCLELTLDEI